MAPSNNRRQSTRWVFGCLLVFILLLAILIGAAFIFLGGDTASAAVNFGPLVNITTPPNGHRAELDVPLVVQARAEHSSMISRVELYADGALVAVQASTLPNGSNPLMFLQRWTPTTRGRHVLMARTYTRSGRTADSAIVNVDVVELLTPSISVNIDSLERRAGAPLPSLNDLSQASGIPVERLRESNPPLRGLDATRPITPGTPIDIPRSPAPPPTPAPPAPPGAPPPAPPPAPLPENPAPPTGLIATADCGNANLNWTDAPTEENYFVYRIAPGDSRLNRIATLPANSTSYRDVLPSLGTYRYQIASVRGGREGLSGMSEARTPDACVPPAPPPATTPLVIALISVETTATFDRGVYCYYQLDSVPWDRAPGVDALSPVAGNPRRYNLTTLPGGGRFVLDHLEANPVVIGLDCWGRSTTTSAQLNPRFLTNHPRAEWDGTIREIRAPNNSFVLRYCISTRSDGCVATPGIRIPDLPPLELPPFLFAPTLPRPTNLRVRQGIDACDELPTDRERGACALSFLFGGVPHYQWDWNGAPFFTEGDLTGYHVVVRGNDGVLWERDVSPGTRKFTLARTGDLPCGNHITVQVQATQGARRSLPSDAIAFDTAPCINDVELTITFESFTLAASSGRDGIVDDGDICIFCIDRRLELLGGFGVNGPVVDGWGWLGGIPRVPPNPFNPFDVLGFVFENLGDVLRAIFTGCMPMTTCVHGGTYNFDNQLLVRQGDIFGRRDNNRLGVNLHRGQTLTIGAAIFDFDLLNAPDAWCLRQVEISRTPLEWMGNTTVNISDDRGEGSCNIRVQIEGRPVR